jgi:hypothetical protein
VLKNPIMDFNILFNSLGNSTCSSHEVVLAFLLYENGTIHNASDKFVLCVLYGLPPYTALTDRFCITEVESVYSAVRTESYKIDTFLL